MSICLIKNVPPSETIIIKTGNRGGGFPLITDCGIIVPPPEELCYLAVELSTPGFPPSAFEGPFYTDQIIFEETPLDFSFNYNSFYITLEDEGWFFAAPCVGDVEEICYLAIQEDGSTPYNLEESEDFFLVNCV